MQENLDLLIKRIDSLISLCDKNESATYRKIYFEIKSLVVAIAGADSNEYKSLTKIDNASLLSREKVDYARGLLGALRNRLIIDGIKTSNSFNWDNLLHPTIYKTSFKKVYDGYYVDAVDSAIKELNFRAKNLYKKYKGKELDGADLFANIFNSDNEKTLLLAGGDLDTQSNRDEQEGYRFLYMGLWKALRNPNAHANTSITKQQAIERLIFISMLIYKLDECVKIAGLIE